MHVLGIETSCDETAAAVVTDGSVVRSSVVSSSLAFHKKYGGIVPEIAFRKQLETITGVVDCALGDARVKLRDIRLIAVTEGPGLLGSLLVGISFAKSLSAAKYIPLVGVDHCAAHFYAPFLSGTPVKFPYVALVVSGGHTSLYQVSDFHRVRLLGSTQDDAAGEAFDKVAKILKLGYPGGPLIEKAALRGDANKIAFSCSHTREPLDFSFSGIKTAVLYHVRKNGVPSLSARADICASFQKTVIDALVEKSLHACRMKKVSSLVIGGGVAANEKLRETFLTRGKEHGIHIFFPKKEYCMDNAAMIAGLGYRWYKKGRLAGLDLNANLKEGG